MLARITLFFCVSLLAASCRKQDDEASAIHAEAEQTAPMITKLHRPAAETDKPPTYKEFRARVDKALAESSPEQRNQALSNTAWDCLELEPELAREAFDKLPSGSAQKNRLIQHFAMTMAAENIDEAIRWAGSLETEDNRSLAFGKIALVLAGKHPERAAQLLSDSGAAGRDLDVAVVQVVQHWAVKSPAEAAAWVALFDPSEARSAGFKAIASIWGRSDSKAAFAWIAGVPEGPLRDEAERGMAEAIIDQPEVSRQEWLSHASSKIRAYFNDLEAQAKAQAAADP